MTDVLELSGLDAQNPLGFFAALGLLRVLDADASRRGDSPPRLAFADNGRALISDTGMSLEEALEVVLADARARSQDALLQLCYDDDGNLVPGGGDGARDLKPAPATTRALLDRVATADRTTADLAASFFSELVQDHNGNTKPTAFHFTAGQQQFLEMVDTLRRDVSLDHLREATLGPWTGLSTLPSLSWDATVARQYALRASNPSKEKRGSVPGANWLGLLGLSFFPVTARRGRLLTSCVAGGWKDSVFTWPTWSASASARTVAALLRIDFSRLDESSRRALGITQVFSARISRSDQGGYGSFSPAQVVLARG